MPYLWASIRHQSVGEVIRQKEMFRAIRNLILGSVKEFSVSTTTFNKLTLTKRFSEDFFFPRGMKCPETASLMNYDLQFTP